jgi:hypothetical protein
MHTMFAVEFIAQVPTSLGYRTRYVAAACEGAAHFRAEQERRKGFPARVIEVSNDEWDRILSGDWDHYQTTGDLMADDANEAFELLCLEQDADWHSSISC